MKAQPESRSLGRSRRAAKNENASYGRPGPNDAGRQEVMDAAAAVFMQSGFDGASIDDIADYMGATKGRVYHYYRRKLDILFDIHAFYLELNLAEAQPIADADEPARDRLWSMSYSHVKRIIGNIPFARVGLFSTMQTAGGSSAAELPEVISKSRTRYEALFIRVLEEGVASGEFRDMDTHLVARALLGALNWTAVWFTPRSNSSTEQERLAEGVADYAVAGVDAP